MLKERLQENEVAKTKPIRALSRIEGHVERITADAAKAMLANMVRNRRVKEARVAVYAEAMQAGEFESLNGETLVVNTEGMLEDGQHRLLALIESGLPHLDFMVVRGVKPGSGQTAGQGAPRRPADIASMIGFQNSNVLMAAVRWLWAYDHDWPGSISLTKQIQVGPLLRYLDENADLVVAVDDVRRNYGTVGTLMIQSIAGFVRCVTDRQSAQQSLEFFECLKTGEGPQPVRTLRDRLMTRKNGSGRLRPQEILIYCGRSWNAFRKGRALHLIKLGGSKDNPYGGAPRFE